VKWLVAVLILASLGGLGFYVWDHNRWLDDVASQNNGAVCTVYVTLDDELYSLYEGGGIAAVGDFQTTQEGASTTTTSNVTTTLPEVVTELRQGLAELAVLSGSDCTPVVSKFPPMTPGRVKVDVSFFRPYPANQQQGESNESR
jgi:hypothetical protein